MSESSSYKTTKNTKSTSSSSLIFYHHRHPSMIRIKLSLAQCLFRDDWNRLPTSKHPMKKSMSKKKVSNQQPMIRKQQQQQEQDQQQDPLSHQHQHEQSQQQQQQQITDETYTGKCSFPLSSLIQQQRHQQHQTEKRKSLL
jgi:hypothetical protein